MIQWFQSIVGITFSYWVYYRSVAFIVDQNFAKCPGITSTTILLFLVLHQGDICSKNHQQLDRGGCIWGLTILARIEELFELEQSLISLASDEFILV